MSEETHVCPKYDPESLVEERLQDEVEHVTASHSGDKLGRGKPLTRYGEDEEGRRNPKRQKPRLWPNKRPRTPHEMLALENVLLQEKTTLLLHCSEDYVIISNEDYDLLWNLSFARYPKDVETTQRRSGSKASWQGAPDRRRRRRGRRYNSVRTQIDFADVDLYQELYVFRPCTSP